VELYRYSLMRLHRVEKDYFIIYHGFAFKDIRRYKKNYSHESRSLVRGVNTRHSETRKLANRRIEVPPKFGFEFCVAKQRR
jgi:hypothetical protein